MHLYTVTLKKEELERKKRELLREFREVTSSFFACVLQKEGGLSHIQAAIPHHCALQREMEDPLIPLQTAGHATLLSPSPSPFYSLKR